MNIIIVGSGTVGTAICAQLAKEGHAITVVDTDEAALTEISNVCDVTGLLGNGAEISVLREAGAARAHLVIAVTCEDEINILCCYAAKKLGAKQTIARVRNPEYSEYMQLMKNDMNLSLTINPELTAASEISRILRFPSAAKIDTFCHGLVELAEFTVTEGSYLNGCTLYDLREKTNIKFLVCCVKRGDEVIIPSGDFVINENDVLCVTASEEELTKFFKEAKSYKRPVKNMLIVGGGRTTYYLAELLKRTKMSVTVIEKDKKLCHDIADQYRWTVINGDGTRQELLLEEGIERADAFLALSDVDEENAIISMYAKTKGVPKVVTMIRSLPYIDFFKGVGIESIVSPKSSTVGYILKFVRSLVKNDDSDIESVHKLMDDKIEALEFTVKEHVDGVTNLALKDIKRKPGTLIACIVRYEKIIIPTGIDRILPGDRVIIVTSGSTINCIKDIKI